MPVRRARCETVEKSDDVVASHGTKPGGSQLDQCVANSIAAKIADASGSGSVQEKDANTGAKRLDASTEKSNLNNTSAASSSMSQKIKLNSMCTDPAMGDSRSHASTSFSPIVFGSFVQYGNPSISGSQKVVNEGVSD